MYDILSSVQPTSLTKYPLNGKSCDMSLSCHKTNIITSQPSILFNTFGNLSVPTLSVPTTTPGINLLNNTGSTTILGNSIQLRQSTVNPIITLRPGTYTLSISAVLIPTIGFNSVVFSLQGTGFTSNPGNIWSFSTFDYINSPSLEYLIMVPSYNIASLQVYVYGVAIGTGSATLSNLIFKLQKL